MYTTIDKVRELSGLDDATNIPDSVVQGKIGTASSMFESAVCSRYSLPLPYHRQNVLTFSGTGSGSGNMTITVNGTDYVIAITSGMTAAQAADAFREAAVDSADFIAVLSSERNEQGEDVVIISKTDSSSLATASAEVNITDAGGTVQGITGANNEAKSDRFPPLSDQMVAEIAAALLLQDNYGIESEDTTKDGDARMENVNKALLRLEGTTDDGPALKLIDEVTKEELTTSSGDDPNFFPTNASASDTDDPTNSKVTINGEF